MYHAVGRVNARTSPHTEVDLPYGCRFPTTIDLFTDEGRQPNNYPILRRCVNNNIWFVTRVGQ